MLVSSVELGVICVVLLDWFPPLRLRLMNEYCWTASDLNFNWPPVVMAVNW